MPQESRAIPLAPPRRAHFSLAPARTRVYLYVLSFGGFKPNPPRPQSALRRPPRPRRRRLSLAAAAAEPHRLARETLFEVDGRGRTPRINSHRGRPPQPTHPTRVAPNPCSRAHASHALATPRVITRTTNEPHRANTKSESARGIPKRQNRYESESYVRT